ncbi:Acetylesterase [Penicillium ucsense]|uniref:Acetylesterase n=1 Tax=Penicillium ucsense TaxID=2839758 RepID=A0A8J8W5K0_9EURO|nr:Acetylesterase [Penicillium ucsense]KAF7739019.1 Acetylesterase [Penicillium ucsense]
MKRSLLSFAMSLAAVAAMPSHRPSSPTYFFTFGDSYSMTSFNVNGTQPSPSNPMGNPQLGTGATGGGINWIGYLTTVDNCSLVLSYNLAIGGATIDNAILNSGYPDMTGQVKTFQDVYSAKPTEAPWRASDTVFGFWIGVNDVGWAYQSYEADELVPKLMAQYRSLIEEVYSDGGRKFLFINVPPTGRSPLILDQGESASQKHAAWTEAYNRGLEEMRKEFHKAHKDAESVLYDSWRFMTRILDHPQRFGFTNATCIDSDGESCVWWNNYHPSQKYHRLQAADMKRTLHRFGAW